MQYLNQNSDTTMYAPGLNKRIKGQAKNILNRKSDLQISPKLKSDISSHVAQIIKSIRMSEFFPEKRKTDEREAEQEPTPMEAVEDEIVEAERQKVELSMPKGRVLVDHTKNDKTKGENNCVPPVDYRASDLDGDFFQITCNIDQILADKVARGEFADVDKLYAKRKMLNNEDFNEKRYEWVSKDGHCYWAEVKDKDNKVNSFKKWEIGFRVYAQLYSAANPHRAAEIWQYVDTIQEAAQTFQWDNVYNYDIKFRRLMEKRPERCWATTNTQLWTTCMKYHNNFQNSTTGGKTNNKKEEKVCWKYNRIGVLDLLRTADTYTNVPTVVPTHISTLIAPKEIMTTRGDLKRRPSRKGGNKNDKEDKKRD